MPAQACAFPESRLVLGVESCAPRDGGDHSLERRLILDEQIPGRGAHEHLDASRSLEALQMRDIADVLLCAAHIEGEVAMHPALCPRNLVCERLFARRQR